MSPRCIPDPAPACGAAVALTAALLGCAVVAAGYLGAALVDQWLRGRE